MVLVKCKCGCFFTVKEHDFVHSSLQCQGCRKELRYNPAAIRLEDMASTLSAAGMALQIIPDDSEVTVTFKA